MLKIWSVSHAEVVVITRIYFYAIGNIAFTFHCNAVFPIALKSIYSSYMQNEEKRISKRNLPMRFLRFVRCS